MRDEVEEEHAQELQQLQDAHTAAEKKTDEQNAARLAEAQAAMQQSVATIESETAATKTSHDEEVAKLQAHAMEADAADLPRRFLRNAT